MQRKKEDKKGREGREAGGEHAGTGTMNTHTHTHTYSTHTQHTDTDRRANEGYGGGWEKRKREGKKRSGSERRDEKGSVRCRDEAEEWIGGSETS